MKRNYPGSLHNHTDHSNNRLRDSINKVSTLIDYAIELGHECVAITDHETLSSFIQVEKYAEKVRKKYPDFKVIRGNEIYLTRNKLNGSTLFFLRKILRVIISFVSFLPGLGSVHSCLVACVVFRLIIRI